MSPAMTRTQHSFLCKGENIIMLRGIFSSKVYVLCCPVAEFHCRLNKYFNLATYTERHKASSWRANSWGIILSPRLIKKRHSFVACCNIFCQKSADEKMIDGQECCPVHTIVANKFLRFHPARKKKWKGSG